MRKSPDTEDIESFWEGLRPSRDSSTFTSVPVESIDLEATVDDELTSQVTRYTVDYGDDFPVEVDEIPSPGLPQEVLAPREENRSPAPSQLVLDLRRLALLLSDIQSIVDRVGGDEHIDSIITELFTWVENQGAAAHLNDNWWNFTLENFEVTYRLRRGSVHQQGSHAHDSTAADRRILAYAELYMNMVGHLPSQAEVRAYFTNENDGHALTRLAETNLTTTAALSTHREVSFCE